MVIHLNQILETIHLILELLQILFHLNLLNNLQDHLMHSVLLQIMFLMILAILNNKVVLLENLLLNLMNQQILVSYLFVFFFGKLVYLFGIFGCFIRRRRGRTNNYFFCFCIYEKYYTNRCIRCITVIVIIVN